MLRYRGGFFLLKDHQVLILNFFKLTFASVVIGFIGSLFLQALEFSTLFREGTPELIYGLPFAGMLIVFLYSLPSENLNNGSLLIAERFANLRTNLSWLLAPLIFITTLITHLFGGSAGREGTAMQVGGALGEAFASKDSAGLKKLFLTSGIAAGFAAVFGTPWAAFVFSLEIQKNKTKIHYVAPLYCAFLAHFVCLLSGGTHTKYSQFQLHAMEFSHWLILKLLIGALAFALLGLLFLWLSKKAAQGFQYIRSPYRRVFFGGALLVCLILIIPDSYRYLGLGVSEIEKSLTSFSHPVDFALKMLFTILTLAPGFKGGEVTPLFFIGSSAGSALDNLLPSTGPELLLAKLGFVAVFASVGKVPLTSALLAAELFGYEILIIALPVCFLTSYCTQHHGIYKSQGGTPQ